MCWCSPFDPCIDDGEFIVDAGTLIIPGPTQHADTICGAGQPCSLGPWPGARSDAARCHDSVTSTECSEAKHRPEIPTGRSASSWGSLSALRRYTADDYVHMVQHWPVDQPCGAPPDPLVGEGLPYGTLCNLQRSSCEARPGAGRVVGS